MKNAIKYFYNLDVSSIRQLKENYIVIINNSKYYLREIININIEEKYIFSQKNSLFHKIIKNIDGSIVTIINDKHYILMKLNSEIRKIGIGEINNINHLIYNHDSIHINKVIALWEKKNDYILYQMSQVGKKYPILKNSIEYFNGITETAIQLLKTITNEKISINIVHDRIKYNDTTLELYDPINLILDSKIRDITEYYKDSFFYNQNLTDYIKAYINYLDNSERIYFMSRIIYPSYFFDMYEDIINGKYNECEIDKILSKINKFEDAMKDIYNYLRLNFGFILIEWLE